MAKRDESLSLLDELMQKHDQEIMRRLDTWLATLNQRLSRGVENARSSLASPLPSEKEPAQLEGDASFSASQLLSRQITPGGISSRHISRRFSDHSYEEAVRTADRLAEMKLQESLRSSHAPPRAAHCFQEVQSFAADVVSKPLFDVFFLVLILGNSIYLGLQLEFADPSLETNDQLFKTFAFINLAFAAIFTLEILLRLFALGAPRYFCGRGCKWNWLDLLVVGSSWLELYFQLLLFDQEGSNSNLRLVRIFRIGKLLQAVRSFRILKFLTALRILVYAIMDATRSLFWALLLLIIMFYCFGLLFTDGVLQHVRGHSDVDGKLTEYFGSVTSSMTTLFRSILGGIDWNAPADALKDVDIFWMHLFHVFIGLACLALLNVMVGVFCNSTIKAAELNHEVMMENRWVLRAKAAKLFRRMDEDNSGSLTIVEFERAFDDENMKAFLESMDINCTDAWTLFDSLNLDGDNVLTLEEFTEGCLLLKGPARSVDVYALKQGQMKLRKQLQAVTQVLHELAHPRSGDFESWHF